MPYILLLIGALAVATAIKGTYASLGQELVTDIKGSAGNPGYLYWVSAIIAVGAVGYYSPAQRLSRAFMILIILGMVLANKGLFARLQAALQNPVEPANAANSNSTLAGGIQSLSSAGQQLNAVGSGLTGAAL